MILFNKYVQYPSVMPFIWKSGNVIVKEYFFCVSSNQCQEKYWYQISRYLSDLVDDLGFPSHGSWKGSLHCFRFQWFYCFLPWSIICVLVTIWAFNIRLLQKWFGSMEAWGDIVFLMECLMPPPIIFIASRQKITFDEMIKQDIGKVWDIWQVASFV